MPCSQKLRIGYSRSARSCPRYGTCRAWYSSSLRNQYGWGTAITPSSAKRGRSAEVDHLQVGDERPLDAAAAPPSRRRSRRGPSPSPRRRCSGSAGGSPARAAATDASAMPSCVQSGSPQKPGWSAYGSLRYAVCPSMTPSGKNFAQAAETSGPVCRARSATAASICCSSGRSSCDPDREAEARRQLAVRLQRLVGLERRVAARLAARRPARSSGREGRRPSRWKWRMPWRDWSGV